MKALKHLEIDDEEDDDDVDGVCDDDIKFAKTNPLNEMFHLILSKCF